MSSIAHQFALNAGTDPFRPGLLRSTYSSDWIEKYLQNQWYNDDPVAKMASQSLMQRRPVPILGKATECDVYEEARSYGADANIVFATPYGGNILIVGANVDNPTSPLTQKALSDAAQLAHRFAMIERLQLLTDRQFEVLELAECGHQGARIAAELGITETAVARLKSRICETLDVRNWNTAVNCYSIEKWGALVAK